MDTLTQSSKEVLKTVDLLRRLDLTALPIGLNSKRTGDEGYTSSDYVIDWDRWNNENLGVGIVLGGPKRLIDIDIDDPTITGLASALLPDTKWRYGRLSKKKSHFIYSSSSVADTAQVSEDEALLPLKSVNYRHLPNDPRKGTEGWKDGILEFRGDGNQSVLPGTIHEGSGEDIEWDHEEPTDLPPEVDPFVLRRIVKKIALIVLISDNAWDDGMRHEVTLTMSGMMAAAKWELSEATEVFDHVMKFTGQGERGNILRAVKDTFKRFQQGVKIGGGPKLAALMGHGFLVDRFRAWFSDRLAAAFDDYDGRYLSLMYFGAFCIIPRLQLDNVDDPDFDTWKLADFGARTANEFILVDTPGSKSKDGDPPRKTKLLKSKIWHEHPRRITYDRTVFKPGVYDDPESSDTAFNLWRGWAVKPNPGASCALWLKHVREYICGGDEKLYHWVVAWCADIVQDPMDKPGTAMVLCSKEGTGKNTFAAGIWKMLGRRYYREMSHAEQLTTRFNSQLQHALLIFANEATFAKDPRNRPILNAIATDDTFQAEKKYGSPRMEVNYCRLLMASNKDHVVEKSTTDRRFTVIDVKSPEDRMTPDEIEKYFTALKGEISGDGPAALLSYLQNYKYRKWDIRRPVVTEAGMRQMYLSLGSAVQFWAQCLNDGRIAVREEDEGGLPQLGSDQWHENGWPKWISKKALEDAFLNSRFHRRESVFEFWIQFYKMSGIPNKTVKRTTPEGRKNTVTLPPLNECIELMNTHCPGSMDIVVELAPDKGKKEETTDEF